MHDPMTRAVHQNGHATVPVGLRAAIVESERVGAAGVALRPGVRQTEIVGVGGHPPAGLVGQPAQLRGTEDSGVLGVDQRPHASHVDRIERGPGPGRQGGRR